jgi:hypothetical protein
LDEWNSYTPLNRLADALIKVKKVNFNGWHSTETMRQ